MGTTWNQRLVEALKDAGKSQADLARETGLKAASVSGWVNGTTKSLKAESARKIELALGVSADWLLTGKGSKQRRSHVVGHPSQEQRVGSSGPDVIGYSEPSFIEIDWANGGLSAGPGAAPSYDEERRSLAFSETWLKKKGFKRKHLVIIEVVGESMEPRLSNGDVALINTADKEIKDHRIYALRYGDDLRIKRLSRRYDGAVVISSDNPLPEFRDEIVPAADLHQLQILGRAVWVGGELL